jgi:photosystem II stability/assembly factor-like uncharacterized protein
MFHTTDGGQTWTPVALPTTPGAFFRVYYLPGNLHTLIAATDVGLFRSVNGPNGPWSPLLAGIIADLQLHPTDASIQFCARATFQGGNGGIYKSTDAGLTWNRMTTTGIPPNNVGIARIAICRNQPNAMAFIYESGCNVVQVLKTADGGASWSDITGPMAGFGNNQACHAMAIAIRPDRTNEILVAANDIWRSVDGGQN